MAQYNAALTSLNTAAMAQFSQMTVTMNAMQVQLKTLSSTKTNQTRSKREHYCWSCGSYYTHISEPDHQRKRDANKKLTTRKECSEVKMDASFGWGKSLINLKLVTLKIV